MERYLGVCGCLNGHEDLSGDGVCRAQLVGNPFCGVGWPPWPCFGATATGAVGGGLGVVVFVPIIYRKRGVCGGDLSF
eukprot:3922258-Pyramimonas_sp.AAC.1